MTESLDFDKGKIKTSQWGQVLTNPEARETLAVATKVVIVEDSSKPQALEALEGRLFEAFG